MAHFEKVSRFKDIDLPLPSRATADSAGYDFAVAEDVVIPPIDFFTDKIRFDGVPQENNSKDYFGFLNPFTLDEIAEITQKLKTRVTLVSTGMKCYLDPSQYLKLVARSSLPLKHWLVVANGVGIVDRDYVDNPSNEGEIFFQLINLGPHAVKLKRGDKIGQGIICNYGLVYNDNAIGTRAGGFGSSTEEKK